MAPPTATETITNAVGSITFKPVHEPVAAPLQTPSKKATEDDYKYKRFLPTFDLKAKRPALTPFEHKDPGLEALKHENPREFLENGVVDDLTPRFGSEVSGVQLHKLDAKGRQQLALFVAQRGVVAFRDQEFIDQPAEWQLNDFGATFGRLHEHPTTGAPAEFKDLHIVYREAGSKFNFDLSDRLSTTAWHSDVTYELQTPGLTFLFLYDSPPTGGDTSFVDQRHIWKTLSPKFKEAIENFKVVHSGFEQIADSKSRGGPVKREPVKNEHPIVRTHPVTGDQALFVNQQFSRNIVGLKAQESDAILNLLYAHISGATEAQARVRWRPRTVVAWDNRTTAHSATFDFDGEGQRRHGARITPQAERAFYNKDAVPIAKK